MAQIAPAASANIAVVAYGSGDLVGVGLETGEELWQASLTGVGSVAATGAFSGFSGSPVIADNIAYAGSNNNILAAFDTRDGQRLWEQPITIRGTPYVAGAYVFVVSTREVLYALNRQTGDVAMALQLPQFANAEDKRYQFVWQGPVMAGNQLWLVSARGLLLRVDVATRKAADPIDIPSDIRHAPVVAGQRLWLQDSGSTLHQFY